MHYVLSEAHRRVRKANELGINLIRYYEKVVAHNVRREAIAKEYFDRNKLDGTSLLAELAHKYVGIDIGAFPKGIAFL